MKQVIENGSFERFRQRYLRVGRGEKGQMLDHFAFQAQGEIPKT